MKILPTKRLIARSLTAFILLVFLVVVSSFQSAYSKQENPNEWVDVIVEGRSIRATVGDIIAAGMLTARNYCQFPAYKIEMGSNEPGYASAVLMATKDCQLIISEINRQPYKKDFPSPPPGGDFRAPIDDGNAPDESAAVVEN